MHGDLLPQSLSVVERRSLAMKCEILALLNEDPDEDNGVWAAEYYLKMRDVLNAGYTVGYPDMFDMIQPEMTRRECGLVHDIFPMFESLGSKCGQLSENDGRPGGRVVALGDVRGGARGMSKTPSISINQAGRAVIPAPGDLVV